MSDIIQIDFEERAFQVRDLDALEQIEKEAGDAYWSRNQLAYSTEHLGMDTRLITAPESYDLPIGFYVVEHGDKTLYLCNLAVAGDWRRCGVGMFALSAIEKLGRELNYQKIALDVQEENLAAQLLYRKSGYRVVAINRNHYEVQDGYHMEKELATLN